MLSVSSASTTVIEPSKGANDWECVDKNLRKLNFGVVFAEVNECCSTKQSFYACIRQHLLDEETNICYITWEYWWIWLIISSVLIGGQISPAYFQLMLFPATEAQYFFKI